MSFFSNVLLFSPQLYVRSNKMSCRKRCTTSTLQIYWLTGRTVKSNQDQWKDDADEDTRRLLNVDLDTECVPCVCARERVVKWLCKWTCQKNVKQSVACAALDGGQSVVQSWPFLNSTLVALFTLTLTDDCEGGRGSVEVRQAGFWG